MAPYCPHHGLDRVLTSQCTEFILVVVAPSERVAPGPYKRKLRGRRRELILENVTYR
jgi:hypothetical protein